MAKAGNERSTCVGQISHTSRVESAFFLWNRTRVIILLIMAGINVNKAINKLREIVI